MLPRKQKRRHGVRAYRGPQKATKPASEQHKDHQEMNNDLNMVLAELVAKLFAACLDKTGPLHLRGQVADYAAYRE